MKSNLAILSSDSKSINLIKSLNLHKFCNLYANCSRNIEVAEKISKKYSFSKYYGSYEELIEDKNIDFVINFLPSSIKFEYSYLCLKNNIKVICNYPVISLSSELNYYEEIIKNDLISNIFLIDDLDYKKLFNNTSNNKYITYYKKINKIQEIDNSLSNTDVLFELSPDLFYFIYRYKKTDINIKVFNTVRDKITSKINYINSLITIDSSIHIQVILDNSHVDNNHIGFEIDKTNEINDSIFNTEDLIKFICAKKPFDNLSDFQYYPFKLFQEVFNE
tara:strand:- start:1157 stop:1987 length:831 start_codon:yes stop_codon:yes gene_type:complete